MTHRALITGVTGQDGSYLADFLLARGYEVHGLVRRTSTDSLERIAHLAGRIVIHSGDLLDASSLVHVLRQVQPREVYNLAGQSFVPASFAQPLFTGDATGMGVVRLLEAVRIVDPGIRVFQASSSEMFGQATQEPQTERTPFWPRSPYGVAKAYAHWATVNYRESYGLFACSGILFNHESPRRGLPFVTRKVSHAVARIKHGLDRKLKLGNLDAARDWGFAGDYVRAMWQMLNLDAPGDYVIATGVSHTVRDLVRLAFDRAGLDQDQYVELDPDLLRPAEVSRLRGDSRRARETFGWMPEVSFEQLVAMMVDSDLALVGKAVR